MHKLLGWKYHSHWEVTNIHLFLSKIVLSAELVITLKGDFQALWEIIFVLVRKVSTDLNHCNHFTLKWNYYDILFNLNENNVLSRADFFYKFVSVPEFYSLLIHFNKYLRYFYCNISVQATITVSHNFSFIFRT